MEEIFGRFPACLPALPCGDLSNIDYSIALLWRRYPDDSLPAYLPACLPALPLRGSLEYRLLNRLVVEEISGRFPAYLPACLPALPLRGSLEYRLLNRLVIEEIFRRFPAYLPTLSLRRDISTIGRITNSYPKSMNPYRIIPLITESYPYTKSHPNMGYDSVICHCLGYDLMRILNDSFLI